MKKTVLSFLLVTILAACSSSESTTTTDSQLDDLIHAWVDLYSNEWLPDVQEKAVAFDAEIDLYCSDAELNTIEASQTAWITLNTAWQKVRVLNSLTFTDESQTLGSVSLATRIHTGHEFDTVDGASAVSAYLLDPSTPEDLFNGNANLQGMPALEYVLFSGDIDVSQSCEGLQKISDNLLLVFNTLIDTWQENKEDLKYPAEVVGGFTSEVDVVEDFLNGLYAYLREINRYKLEIPLGFSSGVIETERAESRYSEQTLVTLEANYAAFKFLFLDGDYNLSTFLNSVGRTDINTELNQIFTVIDTSLSTIETEVQNTVISDQEDSDYQRYKALFDASTELVVLFEEGIIPAAGATENFNKTDGD